MADVDYQAIYDMIKPYLSEHDTIVDAGCGSGYLLALLLANGHEAIGIDADPMMLSLARERLLEQGLSTPLFEHDLRQRLGIKVDVVLAMFDVINYFKGIKTVLQNIHAALKPGGLFIFDLYTEAVPVLYRDFVEEEEDPMPYRWTIKAGRKMLLHHIKYAGGEAVIRQYVHPLHEVLDMLVTTGFKVKVSKGPDPRKHVIIARRTGDFLF